MAVRTRGPERCSTERLLAEFFVTRANLDPGLGCGPCPR